MLDRLGGYNWKEAFKYAARPRQVIPDRPIDPENAPEMPGFDRENVVEILAIHDGENDADDWVGIFRLDDGRFAVLSAGCDYTGWGCIENGGSYVANTLEDLVRWGLADDERQMLASGEDFERPDIDW